MFSPKKDDVQISLEKDQSSAQGHHDENHPIILEIRVKNMLPDNEKEGRADVEGEE